MLKELIEQIEKHTGEEFDLKNKRHFFHLNENIKRLNSKRLRKLVLIEKVLNDDENCDSIYNSKIQYTRNRFND